MTIIDQDHERLLTRNIEDDTRILKAQYVRVEGIPILLEHWSADGVRGKTAIFLTEHVEKMDDAELRRFFVEKAGVEIEGSVTIVRREEHVFFNFGFEIK